MIEIAGAHPELHIDRIRHLAQQFAEEPAYRHIGLRLEDISRGRCQASADIAPTLLHHRGAVQGGIVGMVADATAGYAALSLLDERVGEESDSMTTLEFKTSFLIPAVGDTIRCVAHVVGNGQVVAFLSAQVYVVNEGISKVCALTTLTFKRLRQQR